MTAPKIPTGIGVYIRSLRESPRPDPKQHAKWLSDHGVSWAAIGTIWQDTDKDGTPRNRWINRPGVVLGLAHELANIGVAPHIWGYPWHDRMPEFVEAFSKCLHSDIPMAGFLPDPELGMKRHPEAAREMFRQLRELNPFMMLGITSYGFPKGHPTIPWEEWSEPGEEGNWTLDADYYSPQLYDQSTAGVNKGVQQSLDLGFDAIIPSFGAFRRIRLDERWWFPRMDKKQFEQHMAAFLWAKKQFSALICWSENLINSECWPVVQKFAERYNFSGTGQ
jgi:hypothetical protein